MAKISIVGNAAVFTSEMTLEALATIQKYRPGALKLMGGENNKETLFTVMVGGESGSGSINEVGAYFTDATHDEAKKACITMCLNGVKGDIKEYIADKWGKALTHLNALEAKLPEVLAAVKQEKEAVMAAISVV